jgi:hemoglobin
VDLLDTKLYHLIGEDGFARLTAAFFRRVAVDDILGNIYPKHDLPAAESRLRDFLIGRFGGPMRYVEQRGHPRLRMRHAPFQVDERARNRWVDLMDQALIEAAFPEEILPLLRKYFLDTATFMINYSPSEGPNRLGLRG